MIYYEVKYLYYHIAGKFGEFGKSSVICQTKTIQISTYNYNLSTEFIHLPNFFCQMLETSKFAKLYPCYTLLDILYYAVLMKIHLTVIM